MEPSPESRDPIVVMDAASAVHRSRPSLLTLALGTSALLAVFFVGLAAGGWLRTSALMPLIASASFLVVTGILVIAKRASHSARAASDPVATDEDRSMLLQLMNSIPDAFFTKDRAGVFRYCNQAAATMFDLNSPEAMIGKTVFDVLDATLAQEHEADDTRVLAGESLSDREYQLVSAAGVPRWLLTKKVPLRDATGAVTGLIGVCRDITAFKQAEIDKRGIEAELRAAEAQKVIAEGSNRAKTAFLAMMSHELRTPLNAIIGFSEVLIDGKFGPVNERQLRYLNNILSSGRHQLSLIGSLLDLSKIEAGKLEVTRQKCAMLQLVQESLVVVQPLADAKSISLVVDQPDAATMPFVIADPLRCKQVLFNFLSNAIKFTPKSGTVTVSCTSVDAGRRVRVAIEDTGTGIIAADLPRLFRPFEQLSQADATALGGTGLGLALNRQLVELMRGEVGVESTPGRGSVFFFELPTDAFAHEAAITQRAAAVNPVALIVDDDSHARELMEITLQQDGFVTHVANTGEGALVLAQRLRPSVIVLDVFLPGLDGWGVLEKLRSSAETVHIPVIIATASSDRQKARELGALEHFIKPVDRKELVEALRRHGVTARKRPVHVVALDEDAKHLALVRSILEPAGFVVRTVEAGLDGLNRAELGPCDVVLVDLLPGGGSGLEVVAALRRHVNPPIVVVASEDSNAVRARLGVPVEAVVRKDALLESLVGEINRLMGVR